MKVLITCVFYYPHVGGLATYVRQLERELRRTGHQVDVFAQHPDRDRYYLQNKNRSIVKQPIVDLVSQKVRHGYRKYIESLPSWMIHHEIEKYSYEMAAVQTLDLSSYDIIHAQEIISASALSRIKPKHIPLVATLHGCATWDCLRGLGYTSIVEDINFEYLKLRERYGAISPDKTIVPSHWLKNLLINQSQVPTDQLTVIPYGLDLPHFLTSADEQGTVNLPRDKKVIFCHARLDPVKGHKYLLEALQRLKGRQDWCCYIAGDGDHQGALVRQTSELGLNDRITFLGARNDVPSLLRQVDIVVLPSLSENLPFVVCEAQIAGAAVVATEVGGVPEMIRHEETGLLCPAQDDKALAANIARLLDDHQLLTQLGTNARKWGMEQWSSQRVVNDTMAVYRAALRNPKYSIPDELFLHTVASNAPH